MANNHTINGMLLFLLADMLIQKRRQNAGADAQEYNKNDIQNDYSRTDDKADFSPFGGLLRGVLSTLKVSLIIKGINVDCVY